MSNRFIIAVEGLDLDKQKRMSEYFSEHCSWWHWIDGFWLLVDNSGQLSVTNLRDKVREIDASNNTLLVLQVSTHNWAGYGPMSDEKNMFKWLEKYFDVE